MDHKDLGIIKEGFLCTEKEPTLQYFNLIANDPKRIRGLIEYIEDQDVQEEITVRWDRDDSYFPLLQMICHLRALDSIEVDPFSEEARMGRNYVRGLVFPSNQMRIVMPEEVGDTRFVEFVFADELEEARVMGSVEERGFGNFITSTVEE